MRLPSQRKRYIAYLGVLLGVVGFHYLRTWWSPTLTLESNHYVAYSTADEETTRRGLEVAEILYSSYRAFFRLESAPAPAEPLKLKIYASRDEFKRVHPKSGWAEAFYRRPFCHQYLETDGVRPYHWMVHEATHQLNAEVRELDLPKWANEGIACLFGTAEMGERELRMGTVDRETYPVWWIPWMDLSGDFTEDNRASRIIPIREIVMGTEPLPMRRHFNLYYIHWYTLVHFLAYGRDGLAQEKLREYFSIGCPEDRFEEFFGPFETVQAGWYQHLQGMVKDLNDLEDG